MTSTDPLRIAMDALAAISDPAKTSLRHQPGRPRRPLVRAAAEAAWGEAMRADAARADPGRVTIVLAVYVPAEGTWHNLERVVDASAWARHPALRSTALLDHARQMATILGGA